MLDPLILAANSGPVVLTKADLFRVSIPMREAFRISSGEVVRKDAFLLRLGMEHITVGENRRQWMAVSIHAKLPMGAKLNW